MNKKITPLEAFYELIKIGESYSSDCTFMYLKQFYGEYFIIIEDALKSLEKPYVLMTSTRGKSKLIIDYICENWKEVKITNLEDQNKLKALEIIKEKRVDISVLIESKSLREYTDRICARVNFGRPSEQNLTYLKLTQEEFDFLKKVLK